MARNNGFDTSYFTNQKMERCFKRIFIKQRPFCSPETSTPEVSSLPSYILIEGGIMILHEDAFRQELKAAHSKYEYEQQNKSE